MKREIASIEGTLDYYFKFLIDLYGFEKVPEYEIVREVFNEYRKTNIVVKFIYDGTLRVNILKNDNYKKNNTFWEQKHKNILYLQHKIPVDQIKDMYSQAGNFEKQAALIAAIFKEHPDILHGKLWKLTPCYRLLHKIRYSH